jgi:hypothetical protein
MSWKKSNKPGNIESKEVDMLLPFYTHEDDSYSAEEDDLEANYWLGEYFWSEPSPQNQNEYRQFKLLTLLRLFGVKSAARALEEFTWD